MEKFTASNGVTVEVQGVSGKLRIFNDFGHPVTIDPIDSDTLREFYRAERDEELGRWRWPDNPHIAVYRGGDIVRVLDEQAGTMHTAHRRDAEEGVNHIAWDAARAFFESHPESKPWHDAKTGEIWVITFDGEESAWTVNNAGRFENPDSTFELTAPRITAGRRIWPESD